jgi:hydrogenase expression/formation protein HypC
MCLGIPGRITELRTGGLVPSGLVDFGGATREVCLAYVPEAQVNDYVIVHVGFAISQVDEVEAQRTYAMLLAMDELGDLEWMRESAKLLSEQAPPGSVRPEWMVADELKPSGPRHLPMPSGGGT